MEQAEGNLLFDDIRAVSRPDIGQTLALVYSYDDKCPSQLLSSNSLANVRILHGAQSNPGAAGRGGMHPPQDHPGDHRRPRLPGPC
jgi:hypothetical protein